MGAQGVQAEALHREALFDGKFLISASDDFVPVCTIPGGPVGTLPLARPGS